MLLIAFGTSHRLLTSPKLIFLFWQHAFCIFIQDMTKAKARSPLQANTNTPEHYLPFPNAKSLLTPPGSQASSRGQAKDAALLSSRDADLLEPTEWPQGVRLPLQFGERTRDCPLGKAGKEGPHLARTGASQGFPRAAVPVGVFSRGKTRISGSLSCGAREVRSPCPWQGGARYGSRVMGED